MAKNHNLFVGGDGYHNNDSGMFPSKPANVSFAAHKQGGGSGGLQRDLNFGSGINTTTPLDPALNFYMRSHVIASGDIINAILLPTDCLLEAVSVEVINPGPAGLTCGITITNLAGGAIAYDEANAVAAGPIVVLAPGLALDAASRALLVPSSATAFTPVVPVGFSASGDLVFGADSQYLQISLAGVPADGQLGDLQLRITPLLREYSRYGQY